MSFKLVLVTCLLAVAQATPFLGLRVPSLEANMESRITGGQDARKGEFPHLVSLQWGIPPAVKLSHFCAGTIINPQWILTAGHCIKAVPAYGTFAVKANKHLIKEDERDEQVVKVNRTIVHEKYPGNVAPYDIALIKLETPLKLNANVKAINLPKANSEPNGRVTLSGWGSVSLTSSPVYPNVLQKVNLTIVDLPTCKKSIEKLTGPAPLEKTNICTGPLTGGISACSGDSGGPLIGQDKNGQLEIVGIVSWGIIPCGTRGAPSVYTKVSSYIDWINNKIAHRC